MGTDRALLYSAFTPFAKFLGLSTSFPEGTQRGRPRAGVQSLAGCVGLEVMNGPDRNTLGPSAVEAVAHAVNRADALTASPRLFQFAAQVFNVAVNGAFGDGPAVAL